MKAEKWPTEFKANHNCESCPFVLAEVDIGVGTQRHCEHVCLDEVDEIIDAMEGYGIEPD
jgi:hypothetical protein